MSATDILRIVPTLQATALATNAYKLVKKKRKRAGDFVSTGATTLMGAAIIQEESNLLEGF